MLRTYFRGGKLCETAISLCGFFKVGGAAGALEALWKAELTYSNKGNFDNRNLSSANPLKGVKWNEDYHTVGVW